MALESLAKTKEILPVDFGGSPSVPRCNEQENELKRMPMLISGDRKKGMS